MWDPNIGIGTVTHQNIGYLFPMGPFYWVLDAIGVPDWVSQRLWLGTILLFAGLGMLYLFRTLGLRGPGATVGALAFMLSPYLARLRGAHLGDPAAVGRAAVAARVRDPRRCGAAAGGTRRCSRSPSRWSAASTRPRSSSPASRRVLWIPYAIWVLHEVTLRRALATVAQDRRAHARSPRCGGCPGCGRRAATALDILRYTETLSAVSRTSLPNEILRGLGYWFFYGRDKLGPWIESSADYTQRPFFILRELRRRGARDAVGRVRPLAAPGVLHPAHVRRRGHRGRCAPVRQPDAVRRRVQAARERSRPRAFALRSTGRATPLVVLGLAGAARRGGERARRVAHRARATAAVALALAVAGRRARDRQPAGAVERHLLRQEPPAARGGPAVLEGRGGVPRRAAATTRGCSSSPARTSRRTGGGTRSTRSRPA